MNLYRATVQLLLPGDIADQATACDAVSAALSENLMASGAILDWAYAEEITGYAPGPERVVFDGEEWETHGDIGRLPTAPDETLVDLLLNEGSGPDNLGPPPCNLDDAELERAHSRLSAIARHAFGWQTPADHWIARALDDIEAEKAGRHRGSDAVGGDFDDTALSIAIGEILERAVGERRINGADTSATTVALLAENAIRTWIAGKFEMTGRTG